MKKPLISIVLPVFNVEGYLMGCLKSIAKQTYSNIEVIMVNDGSTDNSREICSRFSEKDSRFRLFDKPNGGLSDARNFGISKINGDFITFIDSDDYVDNDYIGYLYSLLAVNHVKMSICQHRTIFSNGKVEHHFYHGSESILSEEALKRLLYSNEIDTSAWAKLFSKDLFNEVSFPAGKLFEDIATVYKLIIMSKNVAVGYDEKYNYVYRSQSIVNGKFNLKKLDLVEMTMKMGEDVIKKFPTLKKAVRRRVVYARISTLNQMVGTSGYETLRHGLVKKIRFNGYKVLFDFKAPRRDKIALILIYIGYPVYSSFWKGYLKLKKGI